MIKHLLCATLVLAQARLFSASVIEDADWPQLAHDAARTAHAERGVAPPYRARWIWCGPEKTLRNHAANEGWPDDLRAKAGADYPMPQKVTFTLAGRAQPVVSKGRVFVGNIDGRVYAIAVDDGRTLWTGENPEALVRRWPSQAT